MKGWTIQTWGGMGRNLFGVLFRCGTDLIWYFQGCMWIGTQLPVWLHTSPDFAVQFLCGKSSHKDTYCISKDAHKMHIFYGWIHWKGHILHQKCAIYIKHLGKIHAIQLHAFCSFNEKIHTKESRIDLWLSNRMQRTAQPIPTMRSSDLQICSECQF